MHVLEDESGDITVHHLGELLRIAETVHHVAF